MCVKPIDATAAGMNLKQFNFLFLHESELSFGGGLGFRTEKKTGRTLRDVKERTRKKSRGEKKRRIFVKRVTKNVPSQQSIVSFPEEASDVLKRENFILLRIVGGKGRQKRESVCPFPFLF